MMTKTIMHNLNDDISMCFLLKVDDLFYPEREIYTHLPELVGLAQRGKIDLSTTDGAVSICYQGEELLGVELWDEINIVVLFLAAQLPKLRAGERIEKYFPLNAAWVTLTPNNPRVLYEVTNPKGYESANRKRSLPLTKFVLEFELLFWRMTRILAHLGARSPLETIENWQNIVKAGSYLNDANTLRWVIEQPLEIVLRELQCDG